MAISFTINHQSRQTAARTGRIKTHHGCFDTPAFMPVATAAAMKLLTPEQVRSTGSQIILNNAYHLMLRPGVDVLQQMGGTHEFMRWDGPVLTDSGGFQAFSMSDINSVDDDGVRFKSFVDGSMVSMTPERSMEVQHAIGADIIMAFDDCPPSRQDHPEGYLDRVRLANDRTARWLQRCIDAHVHSDHQALFGIVQGGTEPDERARSAEQVTQMDLPGYAIGGVAVGESNELMHEIIRLTAPMLPEQKPRYLMGVGYERDLLQAVQAGVDMFDCVLPTRNGRKAYAFTSRGPLRLRNASFKLDPGPIEAECDCQVCAGGFSRSYLRHLFMADELLGSALVSLHNIRHFQRLMLDIRGAIMDDSWSLLGQRWPVLGLEPAVSGPGEGLDDDSA